jgi:hypothetical protein
MHEALEAELIVREGVRAPGPSAVGRLLRSRSPRQRQTSRHHTGVQTERGMYSVDSFYKGLVRGGTVVLQAQMRLLQTRMDAVQRSQRLPAWEVPAESDIRQFEDLALVVECMQATANTINGMI